MSWLSKLFKGFWGLFRRGLDKFLSDNINDAVKLLEREWLNRGMPESLREFKDLVFPVFQIKFGEIKGTWVSILIDLAWDALKKQKEG